MILLTIERESKKKLAQLFGERKPNDTSVALSEAEKDHVGLVR